MHKIIQNQPYVQTEDFDFEALCLMLIQQQYTLASAQIERLAVQIKSKNLLFEAGSYTRNIVVDKQDYWLGLLNWDKGAATGVHGHPEHTFMQVIRGRLICKNFNKSPLIERESSIISQGEFKHQQGVKGRMDNYIHQIRALEKSLTLHFYSANPMQGEVF